jgi:hypothetical protein
LKGLNKRHYVIAVDSSFDKIHSGNSHLYSFIDWNFVEASLVHKLADLVETKRTEHVDALILKHIEELMQEYDGRLVFLITRSENY